MSSGFYLLASIVAGRRFVTGGISLTNVSKTLFLKIPKLLDPSGLQAIHALVGPLTAREVVLLLVRQPSVGLPPYRRSPVSACMILVDHFGGNNSLLTRFCPVPLSSAPTAGIIQFTAMYTFSDTL